MEAVARQFATDENVMVIRNGLFSFRWTEIFEIGGPGKSICTSHTVLKAQPVDPVDPNCPHMQYAPYPIAGVIEKVEMEQPKVLFAPHVETSTGKAAKAVHDAGAIFVLDCIASGAIWVSCISYSSLRHNLTHTRTLPIY